MRTLCFFFLYRLRIKGHTFTMAYDDCDGGLSAGTEYRCMHIFIRKKYWFVIPCVVKKMRINPIPSPMCDSRDKFYCGRVQVSLWEKKNTHTHLENLNGNERLTCTSADNLRSLISRKIYHTTSFTARVCTFHGFHQPPGGSTPTISHPVKFFLFRVLARHHQHHHLKWRWGHAVGFKVVHILLMI